MVDSKAGVANTTPAGHMRLAENHVAARGAKSNEHKC